VAVGLDSDTSRIARGVEISDEIYTTEDSDEYISGGAGEEETFPNGDDER
jgi:hypothetical protein